MGPHPWALSFSYGRALQDEAIQAWKGKGENVGAGQKAFGNRARLNGAARDGKYSDAMEKQMAAV
jgi:fructose-bisphosphate aldolase class I